jgi:hypothetical protein
MIWSISHVRLFFHQRGQDAAQQTDSRPLKDGRAAENGLKCDIDMDLSWVYLDRSATLGVLALGKRLIFHSVQFLGRMTQFNRDRVS